MNAFLALCRKDFAQFLGNRRAVLMSLVAPVLIAAFLGTVLGGPPRQIEKLPVAVVDLDDSATSPPNAATAHRRSPSCSVAPCR